MNERLPKIKKQKKAYSMSEQTMGIAKEEREAKDKKDKNLRKEKRISECCYKK